MGERQPKKKRPEYRLLYQRMGLLVFAIFVLVFCGVIGSNGFMNMDFLFLDKTGESFHETKAEEPAYDGKDRVDYSVMNGTRIIVSDKVRGSSVIKSQKQFDAYQGDVITLPLAKGLTGKQLTYEYDYMSKKLKIKYPLSFESTMKDSKVDGSTEAVKSIRYLGKGKSSEDCAKCIFTFQKAYAFHFFVSDQVLYIKYGCPKAYYDYVVVIDPGHGGVDYGAYTWDYSYVEKNVIYDISQKVQKEFASQDSVMVYFTRTSDKGVSLKDRVELANEVDADLFLSLHCNFFNGGGAYGVETAYNQKDKNKPYNSKWFAGIVQEEYASGMRMYDRGLLKGGDLKVLRLAKMPACLLEMGFLSYGGDGPVLTNPNQQELAAKTIAGAVTKTLAQMDGGNDE